MRLLIVDSFFSYTGSNHAAPLLDNLFLAEFEQVGDMLSVKLSIIVQI